MVSALKGVFPFLRQVQRQNRFVNLYPFHALLGQTGKNPGVHRQQVFQQLEFVELLTFGFTQPQISQRANDHRLDLVAERQRLGGFFEQLVPAQFKALILAELGHQVVVVGIKPLGQFLRILTFTVLPPTAALARTTGHAEQGVQGWTAFSVEAAGETLGNDTESQRVGQHLVIPGKVTNRQQVNAGVFLQLPVGGT